MNPNRYDKNDFRLVQIPQKYTSIFDLLIKNCPQFSIIL